MVVWLKIETWVIGKGGTNGEMEVGMGKMGEEIRRLLGFVALVCAWVYFHCCSRGYLYQALQEVGGVDS
jgi:hypothetical protein